MNKEIKIITLGDIFKNIETEEKAFRFKDYIKDLQQKVEQLEKENEKLRIEIKSLKNDVKELLKKSYSDDVKITKAVEFIKKEQQLTDIDDVINTDILLNILNKGDDKE